MVYAQRNNRKGESVFKRFTAKLFYKIITRITNISIPVDTDSDLKKKGSIAKNP